MSNLGAIAAILVKDLEDAVRSHTLVLVLVGPVILSVFFTRSFSDKDLRRPELALFDPGRSGLARVLRASDLVRLREVSSAESGRQLVENGELAAFLVVSQGFDEELLADEFPRLDLTVDETASGKVALIREAVRAALREQVGQEIPADIRVERIGKSQKPVAGLLPLWVVFTALSGLMVSSSSFIEEKDSGTLAQVLTAPVSMVEVIVGKVGVGFILATLAAVLVLVFNGITPDVRLLGLTAVGCLAFSSLGVLIGLGAASQSAANAATSAIFMVLFIPVALADYSQTMGKLAMLSPAFYLHRGVGAGLGGHAAFWMQDMLALSATFLGICLVGAVRLRRGVC